jgi:hypothetical protein
MPTLGPRRAAIALAILAAAIVGAAGIGAGPVSPVEAPGRGDSQPSVVAGVGFPAALAAHSLAGSRLPEPRVGPVSGLAVGAVVVTVLASLALVLPLTLVGQSRLVLAGGFSRRAPPVGARALDSL